MIDQYRVLTDNNTGNGTEVSKTRYYIYNYEGYSHVMVSRFENKFIDYYFSGVRLPDDIELDELMLYFAFS